MVIINYDTKFSHGVHIATPDATTINWGNVIQLCSGQ